MRCAIAIRCVGRRGSPCGVSFVKDARDARMVLDDGDRVGVEQDGLGGGRHVTLSKGGEARCVEIVYE